MWIVVAWWSKATANIQRNTNTQQEVNTVNGTHLCPAGNGRTSSAGTLIEEGGAETGGGATRAESQSRGSTGRVQPAPLRAGRRRPDRRRLDEQTAASRPAQSGRKTKANIKIGTLNVCGRGLLYGEDNKWAAIHRMVRDRKIGVLAIQESHLTNDDVDILHNLYGRQLRVLNSQDPTNASGARGTAFVLNRELVDVKNATLTEAIPGRAATLKMRWHAETDITLLNVYTPNNNRENEEFWSALHEMRSDGRLAQPDVLLGDFNLVEDALDRLPVRSDPPGPQNTLRELLTDLQLHDGWRITEPDTRDYTFPQRMSETRSRLDRIYLSSELLSQSYDWSIESTGVPTDHRLTCTRMTTTAAPYIGKARWTMPPALLADQNFLTEAARLGTKAVGEAIECSEAQSRSDMNNPQMILKRYKAAVKTLARNIQKRKVPKLESAIKKAKESLSALQKGQGLDVDPDRQREIGENMDRIQDLERKRDGLARLTATTRYTLNAERVSKYWSKLNKEKKPRDLFFALRSEKDGIQTLETRSDKMAELARDYHEKLQSDGIEEEEPLVDRNRHIHDALDNVQVHLSAEKSARLQASVTRADVLDALQNSASGKATGVDGIPYEF